MKLVSESIADQGRIAERYAFAKMDPHSVSRISLSDNVNPHLAWTDAPAGTKSFVVICHDPDVPSQPEDVNQEGREVSESLPRVDFYHWVLINIPGTMHHVAEGAYSSGITPRGKAGPLALDGTRQGLNDYTQWFAGDHDMNGDYFGYDGPCPPWNDALVHRYIFTVYALDISEVNVQGRFTGPDVINAIDGHVLAKASLTGLYTLNPRLA